MFKEKVLTLGGAIILMLISILGTYLISNSINKNNDIIEMPSIPPIHTQKPSEFADEDLFHYACIDSFDVQKNQIVNSQWIMYNV